MMSTSNSVVNVGELAKPATILVEKISEAVGGIFLSYQIRRVADAEADAKRTLALADLQITKMQKRAMIRLVEEEGQRQANMEAITQRALPDVRRDAAPENIDKDWITHFFERARIVSREEMQAMWAKILAGEANAPGSFSRRTIDTLACLDKYDAEAFINLCHFTWIVGGPTPIVFDVTNDLYTTRGVTFNSLSHLASIGLITFENLGGYVRKKLPKKMKVEYFDQTLLLELQQPENNDLSIGRALFTRIGRELCGLVDIDPIAAVVDYSAEQWRQLGVTVEKQATSVTEAIIKNLRQLDAAANQYFLEKGVSNVAASELIGPEKYLKSLTVIDGEAYDTLMLELGKPLIVHRKSGEEVRYKGTEPKASG